jgi:hypothetical protein
MGEVRSIRRVLVGKPEGKRPLGKPKYRWGIILKLIFNKYDRRIWTGFIYIDHDRDKWLVLVNAVMKLQVTHCEEFLDWLRKVLVSHERYVTRRS